MIRAEDSAAHYAYVVQPVRPSLKVGCNLQVPAPYGLLSLRVHDELH